MTPFAADIIDAINIKARNALITCAHELNRRTDKWTPVWRGHLRRSKRVDVRGNDVYAVSGNVKTQTYILKQYYEPLRHRGNFESGLLDLTALYRDGSSSKSVGSSKKTTGTHSNKPSRSIKRAAVSGSRAARVPHSIKTPLRRTGMGERYLYARAYRAAVKNNQLTKLDAPAWYDRATRDEDLMRDLTEIFVGRL